MGFEHIVEKKIVCKEENEIVEISSLRDEDCDNAKSFGIDLLFDYIIPERVCDVTVDIFKISVLELSHCKLSELPLDCKKLNLQHLGLSHNNFTEVPLCLYSGLGKLESLDLSHNKIKEFNMEPECLPYIKILKLNNNSFENLPKWFLTFKCTSLEEFNYSFNKAKHYKYKKNSINLFLIKLKKLELRNSCLIDIDYSFLKCFKSLQYLDISSEGITSLNRFQELDDLFVKPRWKEMTVLKLNSLSMSIFPEGIAWIYSLKELYVTSNSLSWLPTGMEFLVNLEILDISSNSIVAIPQNITTMEKLTVLQASNNCIDGVLNFAQMASLKTLDLYNNYLDDVYFNANSIDFIDLEDNYYDTEYLENYSMYKEKKNSLRTKFSFEDRYDGPKKRLETSSNSSYECGLDAYYERETDFNNTSPVSIDETENWDLPVKVRKKHSEIDSVDDEWQGEENTRNLKDCDVKEKVYVSDDDWMFADDEES